MIIYCVCELCKKAVMEDPKSVVAGDIPGYVKCRACIMKNQPQQHETMTVVTSSVVDGVRQYKMYKGIGSITVKMDSPKILTGVSPENRKCSAEFMVGTKQKFSIDYRPMDDKLIKSAMKRSYKKRPRLTKQLRKALR